MELGKASKGHHAGCQRIALGIALFRNGGELRKIQKEWSRMAKAFCAKSD